MLREKTKNFKQLCDDPHVRQPRRLPVGAEVVPGRGVHFRVWASQRQRVEVVLEGGRGQGPGVEPLVVALTPEASGYFSGLVAGAGADTLYRYRLDGEAALYPDPASRFQPCGPHGPSQVIDPDIFDWHDSSWHGVLLVGQVIYEMHLGTFTSEGTWEAASRELPELAKVGITVIEIMPIADFSGRFGWGYDGVNLFAPTRLYGTPDDCRRFVDRAHALGLGVIMDVVYNHLGPDGNYLVRFSPRVFFLPLHHRLGRGYQLRRRARRPCARVLPRQCCLLDRRISPRWPAPRRHPEHLRQFIRPYSGGGRPCRAPSGPRARYPPDCGERTAADPPGTPASAGRLGLMPSGTMTSTTAPWRRPGATKPITPTITVPPRIYLGTQVGLPLPGAVVYLAKAASRHTLFWIDAGDVCDLSPEPRSNRQFRPRPALPWADQSRPV